MYRFDRRERKSGCYVGRPVALHVAAATKGMSRATINRGADGRRSTHLIPF